MIKLRATTDTGRKVLVLGITEMNVARLREGKPIHVHGEEMDIPGIEVWITLGKDEASLAKQFEPMIGPETVVNDMTNKEKRQ